MTVCMPTLSRLQRSALIVVAFGIACTSAPGLERPAVVAEGEVQARGARLPYRVFGTGQDTVVMVAGGPAFSASYLDGLASQLGKQHAVIVYDARRRGRSRSTAADTASLSAALDLADLEAVRAHFGLSRFALVAHHYGAMVAASYVRAHPERVTRLVFVGPMMPRAAYNWDLANLVQDTAARARVAALYQSDLKDRPRDFCLATWGWSLAPAQELDPRVQARLGPGICDSPDSALLRRGLIKQQILTGMGNWDYRDSLGGVTQPLLVIQGDREPVLVHSAATWAFHADSGRLLLARGSPFFPWVTDPKRVCDGLQTFLAGRWPGIARRPDPTEVASVDDPDRQNQATRTASSP